MNLIIDTSTRDFYIALISKDFVEKRIIKDKSNHSKVMALEIDALLKNNNTSISSIEKIYIAIGPGSFTGIRIGLTFAKTIAFTRNIPIIPFSTLQSNIIGLRDKNYYFSILDARRNNYFVGIYDNNYNSVVDEKLISSNELIDLMERYNNNIVVSPDHIEWITNFIEPNYDLKHQITNLKLEEITGKDIHLVKPNYLKKTEAEENYENRAS